MARRRWAAPGARSRLRRWLAVHAERSGRPSLRPFGLDRQRCSADLPYGDDRCADWAHAARGRAQARRAADRCGRVEPLLQEHRRRERLHDLQPDPARVRRRDAHLRRGGGRALPRDPRRQLGDRDRAGGPREASRSTGSPRSSRRRRRSSATARRSGSTSPRSSKATSCCSSQATRSSRTGTLRRSDALALDESILTGESAPVPRGAGDEVRSGSFAVEGTGAYVVDGGRRRRATQRGSRARRASSDIRARRSSGRSTGCCSCSSACSSPLGVALGWALWRRHTPIHEAVPTTVAAVVTLVPEGLILLTSLTFAVAAIRMARRGALAQQLNAIESLAVGRHDLPRQDRNADGRAAAASNGSSRCPASTSASSSARSAATPRSARRATRRSRRSTTYCERRDGGTASTTCRSRRAAAGARSQLGRRRLRARRTRALSARRARRRRRTTKHAAGRRVVALRHRARPARRGRAVRAR